MTDLTNLFNELLTARNELDAARQRIEQQAKMIRTLSAELEKFKTPGLMTPEQHRKHSKTINGKNFEIERLKGELHRRDLALERKNQERKKGPTESKPKVSKVLKQWYPESFA